MLYEVNDSDKIFKMVNSKVSGLSGTGSRMVVADSTGNLSAGTTRQVTIAGNFSSPVSTGISINGGSGGKIIMAYVSTQFGALFDTASAVVMITCGYAGNNFAATTVSSYGQYSTFAVEFSQVSGILYVRTLNNADCNISFIYNK